MTRHDEARLLAERRWATGVVMRRHAVHSFWERPLAPSDDAPDSAERDMLAVAGAMAVLLLIVFLSSWVPS